MTRMDLRRHAMDSLARALSAEFPDGWNQEAGSAARRARAWMRWHTLQAQTEAQSGTPGEASEERLQAVWVALKDAEPPCGWRPVDGGDPIIGRAFAAAWPEAADQRRGRSE